MGTESLQSIKSDELLFETDYFKVNKEITQFIICQESINQGKWFLSLIVF